MSQVLVVGSGVAGCAAALAARAEGAAVTVVSAGPGASAFFGGLDWGLEQIDPALPLSSLFAQCPPGLRFVSSTGQLSSARTGFAAQVEGGLAPGQRVTVVGFRGVPQLCNATWIADALREAGYEARAAEVDLSVTAAEARRGALAWASAFGTDGELARLTEALRRLPGTELLLLPPVLGPTYLRLVERLARPVGELVATQPALPGLTLNRLLEESVVQAGCTLVHGEVSALRRGGASLQGGESLTFSAAVLCTGRFLGGGLRSNPLREALFGLPLLSGGWGQVPATAVLDAQAGRWVGDAAPLFSLGVSASAAGQALGEGGEAIPWLFAAGALLAGPDRGVGFALRTGARAGLCAARVDVDLSLERSLAPGLRRSALA